MARHRAHYTENEGYDASFTALVAKIVEEFIANHRPDREHGWIAWREGARLGSIFVVEQETDVAKLRLFFVEHESRGTGLAQRLLDTVLSFASDSGYTSMRLWTHESHSAAGRLYARNGFSMIESRANHAFGCDVIDQIWQRKI